MAMEGIELDCNVSDLTVGNLIAIIKHVCGEEIEHQFVTKLPEVVQGILNEEDDEGDDEGDQTVKTSDRRLFFAFRLNPTSQELDQS